MKKIKIVQFVGIVLFVLYLLILFVDIFKGIFRNNYQLVLSILMAIIGLNLIFKGVIIKSNSTLWFANVLILIAITIVLLKTFGVDLNQHYYIFAIIPLFASLLNLLVFKNLIYIKVIIINISVLLPILINYFNDFNVYWEFGFLIISLLIGVMVCRLINLDKENV